MGFWGYTGHTALSIGFLVPHPQAGHGTELSPVSIAPNVSRGRRLRSNRRLQPLPPVVRPPPSLHTTRRPGALPPWLADNVNRAGLKW